MPLREEFLSLGIEAVIRDRKKSKLQPEEVNLDDENEVLSALCKNGASYRYENRENLEEWEDIPDKDRSDAGEHNSWDGNASGTEKWKAQFTEKVEKGVDHCTAAMMDICTRTFPSAALEQESIGEENESRLGKMIAILCIPLAYFKTRKRTSVAESDVRFRSKSVEQNVSAKGSTTLYAVEATSRGRATDNKGSVRQQKREKEKRKGKLNSSSNRALQSNKSSMLFDTCADSYATPDEIAMILLAEPNSIRFLSTGGRNPLHAVCLRTPAMQMRQPLKERQGSTTARGGLCDTSDILVILHLLLNEYPEVAMQLDFSGDLAMHHLARQLWRLEREWTARVQQEETKSNLVPLRPYANTLPCFITIMKCTEAVLKPLGNARALCQEKGSVGTLLPLHAGCLNGVSFDIIHSLLEGFSEAAKINCSNALPGINDALPLELFESRRPNAWVLERFQVKQLNSATFMQEFDRCSDLIFAYNPNILPYRREDGRLERIKNTIVREAQSAEPLSPTTQMLWIWLCTFSSKEDRGDNYSESVRNVLSDLNIDAIDKLIAVKSIETGDRVLDIANPACAKVLVEFIRGKVTSEDASHKQLIKPRCYTTIGSLCRAIFGVKATYMPTNYIILPYKVTYREDNTLTLVSKDDLQTAINFATFVSHIYTAEEIFCTIVTKSIESISENDSSFHSLEDSVNTKTNSLLQMYSKKRGFLYLLDEATGNPVLPKDNQIYPIEIEMDSIDARNLLRLMQMGMQLMKGKPCLPVLGRVLAKGPFPNVSDVWYDASASVLNMLNETAETNDDLQRDLRRDISLRHLRSPNYTVPVGVDSWKDEISSLRELLQKHDPQHSYSGLRRVSNDNSPTYWTVDTSTKNADAVLEKEKSDTDFGDFETQEFGSMEFTLETTASSLLVPVTARKQPTEVRTKNCKSNEYDVTTSTDEECLSYTAVVDRERFYEESLSYQMSNVGSAESLSKFYAPQQIDTIALHPWVGTEINIGESSSFIDSVSDMASVSSSSTISTRYVAQLVAEIDERRRDDIHPLRMPLRQCEPDVNSIYSVSNERRSRLVDRNGEIVLDELRAAVIAVSEDEERLREGIKELKVALFQNPESDVTVVQGGMGIQKQGKVLVAPKYKTDEGKKSLRHSVKELNLGGNGNYMAPHVVQRKGRQILEELRAVTNSAIEEEAKLRQSLEDLKVDVYQESLKCRHPEIQIIANRRQANLEDLGGKSIGKPKLALETSEEEEETALWQEARNIDELKTALKASEEQERELLHEALAMLELKLALEAADEEEQALREEAAMLQLKAALEAAEKEERALWWERDGLNLAMGRLVEEI